MKIPLQQCLLRKGSITTGKAIFIQGLRHVANEEVYFYLNAIHEQFEEAGYVIAREGMDMRNLSTFGLSTHEKIIVKTFKETFRFYGVAPKYSMATEHNELPKKDNSVLIDVPVLEYARRLAKEGYTPDFSLIKYVNKHWDDHHEQKDAYFLRALDRYGSWEKIVDRAADSIELRVFPKTMSWRENYIVDRVEQLLEERDNKKVAMFNGDYHVGGLVSILLKRGWRITYSNNLELREEVCAALSFCLISESKVNHVSILNNVFFSLDS